MRKLLAKHKTLIKRRGGIIPHIKLSYVFWKIGRDPYVRAERRRLKDA